MLMKQQKNNDVIIGRKKIPWIYYCNERLNFIFTDSNNF